MRSPILPVRSNSIRGTKTRNATLGNVLRDQGKRQQAIAQYSQAIAIDPDHAQAHWNLSLTYLSMGDFAHGWADA